MLIGAREAEAGADIESKQLLAEELWGGGSQRGRLQKPHNSFGTDESDDQEKGYVCSMY